MLKIEEFPDDLCGGGYCSGELRAMLKAGSEGGVEKDLSDLKDQKDVRHKGPPVRRGAGALFATHARRVAGFHLARAECRGLN